jgi:hypothetical protein
MPFLAPAVPYIVAAAATQRRKRGARASILTSSQGASQSMGNINRPILGS